MEELLIWGLVLIAAGFLLLGAELFLPSGGILGVTAATLAIAGVVCMFKVSALWGCLSLTGVAILGPMAVSFAIKIWPSTRMGRMILGLPSEEVVEKQKMDEEQARRTRESVIGTEGVVLVDLRPIGIVEVQGKRYDAISEIGFVQAGSRVRVTGIEGNELRVRQAT